MTSKFKKRYLKNKSDKAKKKKNSQLKFTEYIFIIPAEISTLNHILETQRAKAVKLKAFRRGALRGFDFSRLKKATFPHSPLLCRVTFFLLSYSNIFFKYGRGSITIRSDPVDDFRRFIIMISVRAPFDCMFSRAMRVVWVEPSNAYASCSSIMYVIVVGSATSHSHFSESLTIRFLEHLCRSARKLFM